MELESFAWTVAEGWSREPLPALDSERTLVVVFGASGFLEDPAPFRDLSAAYPHSVLTGCSSSGEIAGTEIVDDSLSVAVVRFERTGISAGFAAISDSAGSFDAGRQLAEGLLHPELRAILVFADGVQVNGSELVRGMNSVLPDSVPVTGGLAGDGTRFQRTWVLRDGVPFAGGVSAIGLYGTGIRVRHGSKGGFDPFGPKRTVTRSEGNVLYELDREPALALYRRYLGDRAEGLPSTGLLFPLGVWPEEDSDKMLVRTTAAIDEENQSITYFGNVPEGSRVQFMRANFDRLVDGAHEAALMARDDKLDAVLSLTVSCVGRRIILGQRTEEEIEAIMNLLPVGSRQIGFYSYGEISPFEKGYSDLHNQTMTLTTIAED